MKGPVPVARNVMTSCAKWKFARRGSAIGGLLLGTLCVLCASNAFGEHTRRWRQSTFEDFSKGAARGVALRSDGRLELAPRFTLLADADASYLWSLRVSPSGALYAAGGSPAKVFRLDPGAKPVTVFSSNELVAQALAFDAKGALYVATAPDGKVYRVSAQGEKSVFFDPKTKYIWDLCFGADGTLYVATGDKGEVFAVAPDGKSELYFASDEAHIRVLARDPQGNLIAGTEPSGRVLRLTRKAPGAATKDAARGVAEGFVLYETAKREVTALAVAPDGAIYAAAIGEKQRAGAPAAPAIFSTVTSGTTVTTGANVAVVGAAPAQAIAPYVAFPAVLASSVYKIAPDGNPEELWSSREDVVYSLGFGADGRLLAGTGNTGTLLAIDGRGVYAQLAKTGSAQVTGIAQGSQGKLYLCTANPGKIISLGPEYEPEGTYESRTFDAQLFSKWGRIDWWSPPAANAAEIAGAKRTRSATDSSAPRIEFFVRSGNTVDPGAEWSRWFGPYSAPQSAVEAPASRFVQWKAVIHDGRPGDGIDWVSVSYLPRNVAPIIDAVVLQDPGVRVQAPTLITGGAQAVSLKTPPAPSVPGVIIVTSSSSPAKFEPPPQGFAQKGWMSVLWSAHDENDDDLHYSVYYRAEADQNWKLLKDKLDQKFYSFDSTSLPDGPYYLKIVASDDPSNPPTLALTTERESDRFVVDNTPPLVEHIEVSASGPAKGATRASVAVKFTARDATSAIERAQYSVDGSEWLLVQPTAGISDAQVEEFAFTVDGLAPGEHTIAVRVYDSFDNVGSGQSTVHVLAQK
jgi:outer membrane protein assembly factor BamB